MLHYLSISEGDKYFKFLLNYNSAYLCMYMHIPVSINTYHSICVYMYLHSISQNKCARQNLIPPSLGLTVVIAMINFYNLHIYNMQSSRVSQLVLSSLFLSGLRCAWTQLRIKFAFPNTTGNQGTKASRPLSRLVTQVTTYPSNMTG